jgi:hypothetical protein
MLLNTPQNASAMGVILWERCLGPLKLNVIKPSGIEVGVGLPVAV